MTNDRKFVSPIVASRILGVERKTLSNWADGGAIKYIRAGGPHGKRLHHTEKDCTTCQASSLPVPPPLKMRLQQVALSMSFTDELSRENNVRILNDRICISQVGQPGSDISIQKSRLK